MGWFDKLFSRRPSSEGVASAALDGFVCGSDNPLLAEHETISAMLVESKASDEQIVAWAADSSKLRTAISILDSTPERQAVFVQALVVRIRAADILTGRVRGNVRSRFGSLAMGGSSDVWTYRMLEFDLLKRLIRRKQLLSNTTRRLMLEWCSEAQTLSDSWYPVTCALQAAAALVANEGKPPELSAIFDRIRAALSRRYDAEKWKFLMRLDEIEGLRSGIPLIAGEEWANAAIEDLKDQPAERQAAFGELLILCMDAKGAVPSGKWRKNARVLVEKVGEPEFSTLVARWFPKTAHAEISEPHMDILRGLAWACGLVPSPDLARALTALALSAYRKVPGKGPRAVRVGNACITALAMMGGTDAVGQLALLKVKVKFGTAQIAIEKALAACAAKAGIPREELEEMSVPAYGLIEVGRFVEPLGDCSAELRIVNTREVALTFRGADGKERKSLPAVVKDQFREELKELSAAKKDIEKMLPAQAERLDSLFLEQKSWDLEPWLERYAEHPLVGALARRLIWNFSTSGTLTPGVWFDGKFVNRSGEPVPLDAQTRVTLWHPLDQAADEVLGWRVFLEERQIRQPFKQAHREIYLLTPAEMETVTYSNRFAAHLLRQHQFNALCAARGWKNKLRLMVDDEYPPASRLLRAWGLRAEFWIEGAGDDFGVDTNESGTYLHVATDQVRFYPAETVQLTAHAGGGGYGPGWRGTAADPVRLADVPPLVFSEIMRDVDLFVGVGSVGNDPAWRDGGRSEQDRGAWGHYAFGDLSATATTRRDVLERLVPKLKIAPQCSFEEKFLVVRGSLRTYKIHLGSGNILMSPNDQYLCIVPSRGKTDTGNLFLPFEGDSVLSVIISKAFLLAADDKINDPSITRQIGRK